MLIGLAFTSLIILVKIKYSYLETITGSPVLHIIIIIVAILFFLVAVTGCYGASTKNSKFLKVYIAFVALLIIFKIVIVVLVFTQHEEIKEMLINLWDKADDKNRIGFQDAFSCCSVDGNGTMIRPSNKDSSCFKDGNVTAGIRKVGCINRMVDLLDENVSAIFGVTGSVMLNEIMIIILSYMVLCDGDGCCIRKTTRVGPIKTNTEFRLRGKNIKLADVIKSDIFATPVSTPVRSVDQSEIVNHR